jgi:hypothetical protein
MLTKICPSREKSMEIIPAYQRKRIYSKGFNTENFVLRRK